MKGKANKRCSWEPFEIIRSTYLALQVFFLFLFFFYYQEHQEGCQQETFSFLRGTALKDLKSIERSLGFFKFTEAKVIHPECRP